MAVVRNRAVTFFMVALVGLFMLASIVLNTVLATVTKGGLQMFGNHPGASAFLLEAVSFLVSAAVFTGVFAMLFKYLPDIKISWKETLIGAAVTAVLFTLGRIALGYYLSRASVAGPFGAAGSLVIVMLFIYYSAQISLFLGRSLRRRGPAGRARKSSVGQCAAGGREIRAARQAGRTARRPRPGRRRLGNGARALVARRRRAGARAGVEDPALQDPVEGRAGLTGGVIDFFFELARRS